MWGYGGVQLAGGVRGAFESSRMGDDSCRGNFFNHHASQGRSTEGKDPVSQDAGECGPDGAKRYLSASGEGDVEGQAPGVIYNK